MISLWSVLYIREKRENIYKRKKQKKVEKMLDVLDCVWYYKSRPWKRGTDLKRKSEKNKKVVDRSMTMWYDIKVVAEM